MDTKRLTKRQRELLDSIASEVGQEYVWAELNPHEFRTAQSLEKRGFLELDKVKAFNGDLHIEARIAKGVIWPLESESFTQDMAIAVRIGAVAIRMLSANQMEQVLRIVLERPPSSEEVLRSADYNRSANAAATMITRHLSKQKMPNRE